MADPERRIRQLDAAIADLERRTADRPGGRAIEVGGFLVDPMRTAGLDEQELERLREQRRRLRRLNPRASTQGIESVPYPIRSDLPGHWRNWYVLSHESARHLRADNNTRFYTRERGRWQRSDSYPSMTIGTPIWALRRFRTGKQRGGGAACGMVRPDSGSLARPSEYIPPPRVDDEKHRSLEIELTGPEPEEDIRFILTASGYRCQRSAGPDDPARFGNIDENKAVTLEVSRGNRRVALFRDVPFTTLMRSNGLTRDHIEDNGPDAPGHLIEHDGRGTMPVLKISPEPPQIGLFFDGTANNLQNDLKGLSGRAPTNIGKLSLLYPESDLFERSYIPGTGTTTGKSASYWRWWEYVDRGIGFTVGNRARQGLDAAKDFFERFPLLRVGTIDVFGFSRGAATARAFINVVHYLNREESEYWGGLQAHVRFAGLYDTVGSIGLPGNDSYDNIWARGDLPIPLNLNLAPESVSTVYHLTAEDEKRKNFPLTRITHDDSGATPDGFMEESMPGAHADIGGGYLGGKEEILILSEKLDLNDLKSRWLTEEDRTAIRDERAQTAYDAHRDRYAVPGMNVKHQLHGLQQTSRDGLIERLTVTGKRHVRAELAYVALERMHQQAVQHNVPLKSLERLATEGLDWKVPEELERLLSKVEATGRGSEAFEELYARYIHHSHRYYNIVNTPENSSPADEEPDESAPNHDASEDNGERTLFLNDPTEAEVPAEYSKFAVADKDQANAG